MARIRWTSFALALFSSMVFYSGLIQSSQAQQDDAVEARRLHEVAANAQNDGNFETAIEKWEDLIENHPTYSQIGKAEFNCGKCYLETQDFEKAFAHLKQATQKLGADAKVMLPESYLYLGYGQYEYGRQLLDSDSEKSNQLLTTATQTFATQLKNFKDFEHNDQVCYFQGMTFELLNRLEDAAQSYEAMFAFKKDTAFRFDGLFFLGNVYERLGQYDKAMINYDQYLKDGAEDPNFLEVQFRTASTLIQMATAAAKIDDQTSTREHLERAQDLFAKVAAVNDPAFQDDAQYQLASCYHRLGDLAQAAKQYEVLAEGDSRFADKAAIWAGRDFQATNNLAAAEKYFRQVLRGGGKYATEAAHFLVVLKLESGENEEAFKIATQRLTDSPKASPFVAELMQDRADAAFLLDEYRPGSPQLYLDLYNEFPNHRLTSSALYNAAFAYLETAKVEGQDELDETRLNKAIELCEEFEAKFENDTYQPDLLEVHADAHLLKQEYLPSQKIYERLVRDYAKHEKLPTWAIRVGIARNMGGQHDAAVQWLAPLVENLPTKTHRAEALHWIGTSHLANKNYSEAELALNQSLVEDGKWRMAPQTMFSLAEAQKNLNKSADAEQTLTAMKTAFPQAKQGIEADFQAAEAAFDDAKYETAIKIYRSIVDNFPESEFTPYSYFGIAWSKLQLKNYEDADSAFTSFLNDFGKDESAKELVPQSYLGRGMSRRNSGNPQGAIEDLEQYLSLNQNGTQVIEARYEIGLAQVQLKQTTEAVATFKQLVDDAPKHAIADRFHYELAWLYSDQKQTEKSDEQFAIIANSFPDSDRAPEAHFKVGEKAYKQDQFDEAVDAFLQCRNSGGPTDLREKAAYRLGWCFYKQKNYDKACEMFQQQVDQFEVGRYNADAWVMIGESLYNQKKMEEAFAAYRKVQPAIDAGGKVAEKNLWLTMLHGSTSANKIGQFQASLEFADQLINSNASDDLKLEGWFEKGMAQKGLRQNDDARESFAQSATSLAAIGAKSRCMIGDLFFVDQKFDEAIDAYTDVFYGYGGSSKDEKIDPWQGYAIYHAARCSYVRIKQAQNNGETELVAKLSRNAAKLYENLLKNYPEDQFASDARKELDTLNQLNK